MFVFKTLNIHGILLSNMKKKTTKEELVRHFVCDTSNLIDFFSRVCSWHSDLCYIWIMLCCMISNGLRCDNVVYLYANHNITISVLFLWSLFVGFIISGFGQKKIYFHVSGSFVSQLKLVYLCYKTYIETFTIASCVSNYTTCRLIKTQPFSSKYFYTYINS